MNFLVVSCKEENFYNFQFEFPLLALAKIFKFERIYILTDSQKQTIFEQHQKFAFFHKGIYFKFISDIENYLAYFRKHNGIIKRKLLK